MGTQYWILQFLPSLKCFHVLEPCGNSRYVPDVLMEVWCESHRADLAATLREMAGHARTHPHEWQHSDRYSLEFVA